MTYRLEIKSLEPEHSRQAFPLVQSICPHLNLSDWTDFVEGVAVGPGSKNSGIIAAFTVRGYIHGLFSYAVIPNLQHGKILGVDNFVAFEFPDRLGVTQELVAKMDLLALDHCCGAVHVDLPDPAIKGSKQADPLVETFEAHGHNLKRLGLCKFVEA
jgi:hypothetical protein